MTRLSDALADRYRIERELGQGGMATVYLAQDLKHDRKVALKVLKPELAAVLGAERFVVEIKTTAALQHPHILPLFDSGTADGFLFYVMPFIDGETLRAKLDRETQLGIDEAVKITTAVADALDYAHRHGVIHRDIKPENILLHEGRPMVADFGIALAVSAAAGGRMTETGLSLGTPHYMSPEQATAEKEISARSDVYSLASVLYEMVAGQPPHLGGSAQQIIMKIVTDPARPLTELRKSVPPNVAAAVTKALEKLPADRFESAAKFAEALGNPGFTSVMSATGAPAVARANRLTAVLGVLVLLLAGLWVWAPRGGTTALTQRVVRFSVPVGPDSGTTRSGVLIPRFSTSRLAISPDGNRLAYSAGDGRPTSTLYERRLDRGTVELLLANPDTGYIQPFYSPDGDWLGFVAATVSGYRQLRRMSLADRSVQTIAPLDTLNITGLTWGDDGTIIATAQNRLYRIPASGGEWRLLAEAPSEDGQPPRWFQPHMMPGSRTLLFHSARSYNPEHADIVALDLATGEQQTVLTNAMNPIYSPTGHLLFMSEGALMGVTFDPRNAAGQGQPVVLIGDVMQALVGTNSGQETGAAQVALSMSGDLAYAPGGVGQPVAGRVVRITPRGDTIPVGMEHRDWIQFRLSPDGARLAAVSRRGQQQEVWIHDLARGVSQRLNTGGYGNWPLEWSPDSRSLLLSSDREQPGRRDLFIVPADGTGQPARIAVADQGRGAGGWSSQGVIAFLQGGDIWVIPPDSQPRPFITSTALDWWPSFSPDGRWLAYSSNESGRMEVYVRPYPAGAPATIVSTGGGFRPAWSRDGRKLFFDDSQSLLAVDLATGPDFRPGPAYRYLARFDFQHAPVRGHDIFPDGSVVYLIHDPSAVVHPWGAPEIQVILNFAAELKERVRP
jgi:serine/threonine-protein kinase